MDFQNPNIFKYSAGLHKNQTVIWIHFEYNKDYIVAVKKLSAHWSQTQKCWYAPDTNRFRAIFGLEDKVIGKNAFSKIAEVNRPELKKMHEELQLKAYSTATIKTYLLEFAQLLYALKNVPVASLSYQKLRSYFLYCITKHKISENHLHSRINAVKFYFEQVLKKDKFLMEIPRPKKPSILPKAFNQKDILRIFSAVTNEKHLLMLKLCYGMGLRVSEVVALKLTDIDSRQMHVLVQSGKGKKDRYAALPKSVLEDLRNYYKKYKPTYYLFEGQSGGKYTTRSLQIVFKNAMKNAGINKPVGVHGLRHSYATHLLDYGTEVVFIQKLLGHKDIKTTQRYLSVTNQSLKNLISPLDRLQ